MDVRVDGRMTFNEAAPSTEVEESGFAQREGQHCRRRGRLRSLHDCSSVLESEAAKFCSWRLTLPQGYSHIPF